MTDLMLLGSQCYYQYLSYFASMTLSLINVYNEEQVVVNFYHSFSAALVAFIAALLSIMFLMRFIKQANFNIFIIYRIVLGIILLVIYV